jgi:hypothetical protein
MSKAWATLQTCQRHVWLLALCAGAWLLSAQGVCAQSARETAMARALFEEGVIMADRARWDEAVDRFRRAQALKPTPGITFNLAAALAESGKVIEASEMLESLARDPAASAELKRESESKLAEIAPRRAFLTLHVQNAPGDAHVKVDGQEWPQAAWEMASPIDPGTHTVVGSSGEQEALRESLTLGPGERRELSLSWPMAEGTDPASSGGTDDQSAGERKPLYKSWLLWTGVGAVVVGGVIAAVMLTGNKDPTTEAPIAGNTGVVTW